MDTQVMCRPSGSQQVARTGERTGQAGTQARPPGHNGERGSMNCHWQNLNEDRRGDIKGSGFWHGRAWWTLTKNLSTHAEWVIGGKRCALEISIGGESNVFGVSIGIPLLLSLFLDINYRPLRRFVPDWDAKVTGVRVFDWSIWVQWWKDEMGGWTNYRSKWRNAWFNREFNINILDVLLGRQTHTREELETKPGLVSMPEGTYPISVTFDRRTWKRPRWFAKSRLGAHIECLKPIGFPGKGENSWDCGDDAIHSMSCDATNMAEAIARVTESVMRSRERHGTINWKPGTESTANR